MTTSDTEILSPHLRGLVSRVRMGTTTTEDADLVSDFMHVSHRVLDATDFQATFYDAQSPVEDWALTALVALLEGRYDHARALFARFDEAEWGDGAEAATPDPAGFIMTWEDDHSAGEHVTPDPNCIACPRDGFSHITP